jgi:hypothetical protein
MSISARFAVDLFACALLAVMFWAACAGVGWQLLPRPATTRGDDEPASWRQAGVAACVGLGLLLMLSGFAMVIHIPWWLVVLPFMAAGLALAVRGVSRAEARGGPRSALVFGAIGVAALALIAVVEAPVGLRFPLNICDDFRAYLPMAQRFVATSGLEEAWSSRRIQSLGGFDLLRALPVAVFGNAGAGVAETVIASVFIAGLFVANGVRSTWARVVSVGLVLAVPFLWVPRSNTTGVLMGSPLLVASLGITIELRRALREERRRDAVRWALAGGLIAAALTSVRPNLGLLAALFLAVGALSATPTAIRERARVVIAAGVSTVVAVAPWSFAMWRTAGSPLYPLFPGNLNSEATYKVPLNGVTDLVEHAWDLMTTGPYLWVSLGVVVIAVAARGLLLDAPMVATAAILTVLVTLVFALSAPTQPSGTFVRYIAPMSGALALFLICEALRAGDIRKPTEAPDGRRRPTAYLAVIGAIVLGIFAFSVFGFRTSWFPSGYRLVEISARDRYQYPPGQEVSTPELRRAYAGAFRRVDPDRTIVAVDRPYLIDYERFDVPNLDAPGYMTPDGAPFSFFAGPGAKVAYLRERGYDTLVATDPAIDVCLNPSRIARSIQARPADRRRYRLFLDWTEDVQAIAEQAPDSVRRAGSLLVIDLSRAERELAEPTGVGS